MNAIPAIAAEGQLAELLDRVAAGEAVKITRDGRPVAILSPVFDMAPDPAAIDVAIRALQTRPRIKLAPGETIRDLIDEGRRF